MTPEQQRAIAIARAKMRLQGGGQAEQPTAERTIGQRLYDNIIGDPNDGVDSWGEQLGTWLNRAGESATLGLVGDEASAAAYSALPGRTYGGELERFRANEEGMSTLGRLSADLGGALIPGAGMASMMARAASLPAAALRGALLGGGAGATHGFMEGEGGAENRGSNMLLGAGLGATIGGAIPLASAGVKRIADALMRHPAVKSAARAAPSRDELRRMAGDLYSQAEQAPSLSRQDFAQTARQIVGDAQRHGMDDMLTPGASRVAGRFGAAADDVSPEIGFRELDILRRQAGVPAGNFANRTEQSIGSRMISGIDDFVDAADPNLSGVTRQAREVWGRLRRSEMIEQAVEKARNSATGFERGLQNEFRRILNNPKLRRGFGPDEIREMERAVRSGLGRSALRQFGRLGIGTNSGTNAVGAVAGSVLGGAVGGPVGSVVTPMLATGARALSERAAGRHADIVQALVRGGGGVQAPQMPPAVWRIVEALMLGNTGQGASGLRERLFRP